MTVFLTFSLVPEIWAGKQRNRGSNLGRRNRVFCSSK